MTITITAFEGSPDGGKGLARDTRVRWALEEVDELQSTATVNLVEPRPSSLLGTITSLFHEQTFPVLCLGIMWANARELRAFPRLVGAQFAPFPKIRC